jgi:hypothetical protein
MAVTRQRTLRWAPVIQAELARANIPLPVELILALMDVESQGFVGLVNPKSGASGLLQVMPKTLNDYNAAHTPISLEEMRSQNVTAAPKQIRVGLSVLASFWKGAYRYLVDRMGSVPIDELARIADLFYVAGPGATKSRLDHLSTPTWGAVQAAYPTWNALPHPRNVFSRLGEIQWPLDQISEWIGKEASIIRDPKAGLAIAVAIGLAAWYMLRKKSK